MASLALALLAAASLPFAYRIDPLAPLISLALIPAGGLAALLLGLHADSIALTVAGALVALALIPVGYHVTVVIGGP